MNKLELVLTSKGYGSIVKLNGQEIKGVRSIELWAKAGEAVHAKLDILLSAGTTVVADAEVVVTQKIS